MDTDRLWFEQHPHASEYWRPVTLAEIAEQRLAGALPDVPARAVGRVRVSQLAPGVRRRHFSGVCFILDDGSGAAS